LIEVLDIIKLVSSEFQVRLRHFSREEVSHSVQTIVKCNNAPILIVLFRGRFSDWVVLEKNYICG
jgi:hypothetical protein